MTTETAAPRTRRLAGEPDPAGREELVAFVSKDLDTTKADSNKIVDSVTRGIASLAGRFAVVRVPNLGNFRVIDTKPRQGRNPRTSEVVAIDAGRRVSFRAAKVLKDAVKRKTAGV
jgi:nucleoid DNA-binding protein